jgi:hypothetical protein
LDQLIKCLWISLFNVCVAVFLLFLVLIEVMFNVPERSGINHSIVHGGLNLGTAYASFAFSFGAHAVVCHQRLVQQRLHACLPRTNQCVCAFRSLSRVLQLPSVYETMKTPSSFSKMIIYTFSIVLVFYLPLAVVGYWAYGDTIQSPIYDSLCDISNPDSCSVVGKSGVYTAILAVSIHVLMSYAIVLNPTELEVCHPMLMTCNVQ